MDGKKKKDISIGDRVSVVEKSKQKSGLLTEGIVAKILTNSNSHPHGIKVRLQSGKVGRVKKIHTQDPDHQMS